MATRTLQKKERRAKTTPHHAPTLKTIQMIEEVLSSQGEFGSKNKLSRALPRQVQPKTINTILDYLEKSNKIMFSKDGAIMWLAAENNPKLMKLHRTSTILR